MTIRILLVAYALFVVNSASAHTGDLSYIATLCLAKDPGYASLPMGRAMMQQKGTRGFLASMPPGMKQCLRSKRAESAELCKNVLSIDPNQEPSREQLEKIFAKYDIEKLYSPSCQPRN